MKKINWKLISWIIRSCNRLEILKILDSPQRPTKIAKKLNMSLTHASKIIRELNSKKLIFCLNEQEKIGRLYKLSLKGKKILKYIANIEK